MTFQEQKKLWETELTPHIEILLQIICLKIDWSILEIDVFLYIHIAHNC